MLRAWLRSLLSKGTFPLHIHIDMSRAVIKVSFREGLSRTVSCPNGGSCASIAAIANKQRYLAARRCPKHKTTPQI